MENKEAKEIINIMRDLCNHEATLSNSIKIILEMRDKEYCKLCKGPCKYVWKTETKRQEIS